jgi:phosphoenolpyruvate carboxykinase (ATP)
VLDRAAPWSDKQAYDETARGLTQRFEANFREYEPFVGSEIKEVAIRAAA